MHVCGDATDVIVFFFLKSRNLHFRSNYLVFTEGFVHRSEHFILQTWQKLFLLTAFSDIFIGKERRPKFPL